MSSPVFDEESPPRTRARKVKAKILSFLSNKLSVSKNLPIVSEILPNKFEPLVLLLYKYKNQQKPRK